MIRVVIYYLNHCAHTSGEVSCPYCDSSVLIAPGQVARVPPLERCSMDNVHVILSNPTPPPRMLALICKEISTIA